MLSHLKMHMNKKILVTNIQRFSLHDGPGIRTTVFLKGCSLRCPWCSNPENLSSYPQPYNKEGAEGIYGNYYTPDQLYDEILKDKAFYEGEINTALWKITDAKYIDKLPGGVTFSGGECLLKMNILEPLLIRLKSEDIHMAIESSLFGPLNQLLIAVAYIDFFYIDVKILDRERCRNILQGNLESYIENLQFLLSSEKPIVFRIPVIGGFTEDAENRARIVALINNCCREEYANVLKVELIKEHSLGKKKMEIIG